MQVLVNLLLTFAHKAPGRHNPFELELVPGSTVGQTLESLSISAAAPKVIMVNGRVASLGLELKAGDELTVFPPLTGG